jgi:hypothetical protein
MNRIILKIDAFWVVVSCSMVQAYRRFRGVCCLHHQGSPYDGDSKYL